MINLKPRFIELLSIGVTPAMESSKKLAIQIATFDALLTLVTILFYFFYTLLRGLEPLYYFHFAGVLLQLIAVRLIAHKFHDAGRFLSHLTALGEIFLTADAAGVNSGYEFYYFTSVTIPFVTFALGERHKGMILSGIAIMTLISQQFLGTGLILPTVETSHFDKLVSIIVVMLFMVAVLSVARFQLFLAQQQIKQQHGELIHSSNLVALGEMAGGIAHEINNPLLSLSLNVQVLRRQMNVKDEPLEKICQQLDAMDATINRMSKMIKGMSDLSRDVSDDPLEDFSLSEALDVVLTVSSQRLNNLGIKLNLEGNFNHRVNGHMVQLSQVLINLLNNSIDALEEVENKWILIEIRSRGNKVLMAVVDSGPGIPDHLAEKIMQPFFTTKPSGKGTGLGLSISRSIIEKNGGNFYYDRESYYTRFVVELPKA